MFPTKCKIYQPGAVDIYGQQATGASSDDRCAVVKLISTDDKTPVRRDSSASRGMARELVDDARLLFPSTSKIALDWGIDVLGMKLKVVKLHKRFDAAGRFDHIELDAILWQ